jgi:hypothetical protein
LNPQEFVGKWRNVQLKERSAAQEHFLDLCQLLQHPTPAEFDPTGQTFTFEAGVAKQKGGSGFADVWKKGFFAWEYKGKHANLDKAYQQLLQYRESLQNPPLLVVSDTDQIIIHTNFTNTIKRVETLTLDDLLTPAGLTMLKAVFYEPERLKAIKTTDQVTREAAAEFARLADLLRGYGEAPHRAAHFLIRLLFCLFAEDIDLLPQKLFNRLVSQTRHKPPDFTLLLHQLFQAMATGGWFGVDKIAHFDGGLFDAADVALELDSEAMQILAKIAGFDWSSIEPSILGTLFERSLDPAKRSQLGAHYTSKEGILLIVEPVLMQPLRRRWASVQAEAKAKAAARDQAKDRGQRTRLQNELQKLLTGFAAELAQATVWIGYIQWLRDNGFGQPSEPILKPLYNIVQMDAILAYYDQGRPIEPDWPEADVVIGNPPFLGEKKMRAELGDDYVDALLNLYSGRLPASDLVCYWFEKTRMLIENKRVKRAGLLATQGIRGGANRKVLERIKESGDIFWAWDDRNWILGGATVHVSMVGFDSGIENQRELNGLPVDVINADLTTSTDLTSALVLNENLQIAFMGDIKVGSFDIDEDLAKQMLNLKGNPNGRPNSDVIRPWVNGLDITRRPRQMWIIDFGVDMSEEQAALYEAPFEYVKEHVKSTRVANRMSKREKFWWIHGDAAPRVREALFPLNRYIATPRVTKHRLFVFLPSETLPDGQLIVFARDDDYFLGMLHSKPHELWARGTGTQLREAESGFRYTPTTCFETFPFPWPPGQEPKDSPLVQAIAQAAQELVAKRDNWLNPPGASEAELKQRTLTNLYNQRPTWLDLAHQKLDQAVLSAYHATDGRQAWLPDLTDEQILAQLLDLNLRRAARSSEKL